MFCVIFEGRPRTGHLEAFLDSAERLKPELEQVEGFVSNIRYRSLDRHGWLLSLSDWQDEKALVRFRTARSHDEAQEEGREKILADYHVRVGEVVADTRPPAGCSLTQQRFDETAAGAGTAVTLVTAHRPAQWQETNNPADCSEFLGLDPYAEGMLGWDVFDDMAEPGNLILLMEWKTGAAAEAFEWTTALPPGARLRRIRIIRDYGLADRREAPQYYPAVARPAEEA
jgi:heme-degrading monooxygenase HmoA